jgi:hypothetical protein
MTTIEERMSETELDELAIDKGALGEQTTGTPDDEDDRDDERAD